VSLSARDAHVDCRACSAKKSRWTFLPQRQAGSSRTGTHWFTSERCVYQTRNLAGNVYGWYRTDPEETAAAPIWQARWCASMRANCGATIRCSPGDTGVGSGGRCWQASRATCVFRVQGPLNDFPFENDKTGLFEVKTR